MSEYLPHVQTSGPDMFLPYFPSHSMNRDVVMMTTTCDHHKERGLSCPFWDRRQSGFAHARHIARPSQREESVSGHLARVRDTDCFSTPMAQLILRCAELQGRVLFVRLSGCPNAIKNITLLPCACGEKNFVTSSSKNVNPVAPRSSA